jgi:hypothetical protein
LPSPEHDKYITKDVTRKEYDELARQSKVLHGHRYVLPVAAWIQDSDVSILTAPDAVEGLAGRADKIRVIEALVRLNEIGAIRELPRESRANSPRFFEKERSAYWEFLAQYLAEVGIREGIRPAP